MSNREEFEKVHCFLLLKGLPMPAGQLIVDIPVLIERDWQVWQAATEASDAKRQALSVTNILLRVEPDDNGCGVEVYAKSVNDVESRLSDIGSKLEDYELGIKVTQRELALQARVKELEEALCIAQRVMTDNRCGLKVVDDALSTTSSDQALQRVVLEAELNNVKTWNTNLKTENFKLSQESATILEHCKTLEALIKESKEPVAEVIEFVGDSMFIVRIDRPTNIGEFLFAAPVMKEKI